MGCVGAGFLIVDVSDEFFSVNMGRVILIRSKKVDSGWRFFLKLDNGEEVAFDIEDIDDEVARRFVESLTEFAYDTHKMGDPDNYRVSRILKSAKLGEYYRI